MTTRTGDVTAAGEEPTDETLVAAYVDGDAVAFDRLVERHRRRVFGICLRYFGDAADAEDAMQDAFVSLLRRAETFRGGAAFSTWMYRVATNACNDLARKRSRRPRIADTDVSALGDRLAVTDDIDHGLDPELAAALDALDPTTRDAIVLHDVHGLAYADIAARLELPIGTVKSRIHRGHARLAAALAPAGEEPGTVPGRPTAERTRPAATDRAAASGTADTPPAADPRDPSHP